MTLSGRGQARARILRWTGAAAAILVLLTLLFLAGGHWILAVLFGVAAAAAIWVFLQARTVR
jgi:hypothetical protein